MTGLNSRKLDIPLILAGGLTPDNVIDAIHTTGAFAVDVSGGVESAKGIKDQQLIERFMQESNVDQQNNVVDYTQFPDANGHFGIMADVLCQKLNGGIRIWKISIPA